MSKKRLPITEDAAELLHQKKDAKSLIMDNLIQCTSCSGFFEPENTRIHGDDDFCINCSEGINNEVKQDGIKHLDEFLKSNKLEKKFWLFARAKWSGITVKELKELEGE